MILLDNDMGVRIVRANGMATIQVLDDRKCWVDFYKLQWVDLAQGKINDGGEADGDDCQFLRVKQLMRCVAMAAACAAREELAPAFGGRP